MKNIQVIDGAKNCVYDIFAATEEEFTLIFPAGEDVAFIDEVCNREDEQTLDAVFAGRYVREERLMLTARGFSQGQEHGPFPSLNMW